MPEHIITIGKLGVAEVYPIDTSKEKRRDEQGDECELTDNAVNKESLGGPQEEAEV